MAHSGYEYDEVEDDPTRRLRAHCTPAVESPFTWLDQDDKQADD
ncbi:MAG: hypothetical protein ACRDRK_03795 [Pseudonocardia sp.]